MSEPTASETTTTTPPGPRLVVDLRDAAAAPGAHVPPQLPRFADDALRGTRDALHAVVEGVLAGPQHRTSGKIRLTVEPGAICTVAAPRLRLTATTLSGPEGEASLLAATSQLALGAAVGVSAGPPVGVYADLTGVAPDEPLGVDSEAAVALLNWFAVGAAGLLTFAPDQAPVLWPEHFDLAISVAGVNYGVVPGDGYSAVPYAYVGPHAPVDDDFFDAPFGAVRTWAQVPDAASIAAFFAEGRDRVERAGPR